MRVSIEHGIDGAELAVSRVDAIIIVDTIRASTTYVNAFGSGAERIVPCSSQQHLGLKSLDYNDALKSGERLCKKIEGYDLGSSPEEMSSTDLKGRTILSRGAGRALGRKAALKKYGSTDLIILVTVLFGTTYSIKELRKWKYKCSACNFVSANKNSECITCGSKDIFRIKAK